MQTELARDLGLEFGDPFEGVPATETHRLIHTGLVSAGNKKSSDRPEGAKQVRIRKSTIQPHVSDKAISGPMRLIADRADAPSRQILNPASQSICSRHEK